MLEPARLTVILCVAPIPEVPDVDDLLYQATLRLTHLRHFRESGNPCRKPGHCGSWMPAFASMTCLEESVFPSVGIIRETPAVDWILLLLL